MLNAYENCWGMSQVNEKFILNSNAKRLHSMEYADGRCKLKEIDEVHARYFYTPEEALTFPGLGKSKVKECSFCMPKYRKAQEK